MKLWNYIKDAMMNNLEQTVCESSVQMTYQELVIFSELFAEKIKNEKCCAILCHSEMAAAMSLLACFAAGVTAVPLSTRYGEQHCQKILETISPTAIITDANNKFQVIRLIGSDYTAPDYPPALIMCTSGTTGTPKGAMLSAQNIISNVSDICDYFDINNEDTILIARPLYHCAVLTGELITSLVKGARIRFSSEKFNPKLLLDLIYEYNITVFCGTPTILNMMTRFKKNISNCTLKKICVSGECLSNDIGQRITQVFPSADIYHVYGLTEASPRVSYLPVDMFKEHSDSVGIPLKSVSLKIIKSNSEIADKNEEGILWISGPNIMMGYYNSPTQTESVLKDGWLCTGDVALIDSNGLLKIKGRSDDLIIRGGMNIYPSEIENAMKTDQRVCEVMVYQNKHPRFGTQIGMKISGDFADLSEVKTLCAQILPEYQIPSIIELCDNLPKSISGKIIRLKTT